MFCVPFNNLSVLAGLAVLMEDVQVTSSLKPWYYSLIRGQNTKRRHTPCSFVSTAQTKTIEGTGTEVQWLHLGFTFWVVTPDIYGAHWCNNTTAYNIFLSFRTMHSVQLPMSPRKRRDFKVVSDLGIVTGLPYVSCIPSITTNYRLTVFPWKRGVFNGVISFIQSSLPGAKSASRVSR